MRNLFLVLVLGNLGFAAWYFWIAEPATGRGMARESDLPGITLMSELGESPAEVVGAEGETALTDEPEYIADAQDAEDLKALVTANDPIFRCVGIGPFSELARFDNATEILRAAGFESRQRTEEGDVWLGHWIYLANVTTQGQADTLSAVLAENGVVDTYFDPTGAEGDVLSLGIFREFTRAETIRERVLDAGFEPVTVDRTRPGTLFWADLILDTDEDLDLQPLQTAGRIVRLEERVCDDP